MAKIRLAAAPSVGGEQTASYKHRCRRASAVALFAPRERVARAALASLRQPPDQRRNRLLDAQRTRTNRDRFKAVPSKQLELPLDEAAFRTERERDRLAGMRRDEGRRLPHVIESRRRRRARARMAAAACTEPGNLGRIRTWKEAY